MWDFRNNPADQGIYTNAFNNALNLIAGRNGGDFKKLLSEKFRKGVDVTTYSAQKRNSKLDERGAMGLTGLTTDDRIDIKLYGLGAYSSSEIQTMRDFQHNATHETFHAWAEILPNIIGESKDKVIGGIKYRAISGTIYKERTQEQITRNEDNKTYGGGFNECLMDILAECAFAGYDNTIVQNTNVDSIIKDNKWYNNKGTAYSRIL